jgi:predicted transcriptional regulator
MQKIIKRKRTGSQRLGKLIKESRLKMGLSGGKLAALVGIDRTHISKIEHGAHAPDFTIAQKISEVLCDPEIKTLFLLEQYPEIDTHYKIEQDLMLKSIKELATKALEECPEDSKRYSEGQLAKILIKATEQYNEESHKRLIKSKKSPLWLLRTNK